MRIVRIIAAVSALTAGYAHLKLYSDGYSDIPVGHIGTQFLLNALSAVVIAAALVAPLISSRVPTLVTRLAPLAGIGWGVMSLVAFFVARTSTGWFGFQDLPGLNPSPEAQLAVFPEIIVVIACGVVLAGSFRSQPRASR
jgi:ethanolamine transporter EutH